MSVSEANWKWFGHTGHFICGQWCRFHLCTHVGSWLISTVGEYVPDDGTREILARSRGIKLEDRGDDRLRDWLRKNGFEKLGAGPQTYETMVFRAGLPYKAEGCGCGMPVPTEWLELECARWMSAGEATKGHYETCRTWAERESHDQVARN